MEKRGYKIYLLALLVLLFISSGCGQGSFFNEDETIIVQNRSGVNGVQVYIDGVYKGTVDNKKDLVVKERDYDDTDIWIDARNSNCEWNTIYLHVLYGRLDDGETVTVTLGLPKQSPTCWEGPGELHDLSRLK